MTTTTPREDLVEVVLGLALEAIHEQTAESTNLKPSIELIRTALQAWSNERKDAELHRVLDHIATLSDDAREGLGRSIRFLQGALRVAQSWRARHEAITDLESLGERLKSAGLRPLPRRRFPPYPQVQMVISPDAFALSLDQQRAATRLATALQELRASEESSAIARHTRVIRKELVLAWQSSEYRTRHDTPEAAYEDFLADLIPEVNDTFANAVGIDPRFANFVPFAWLAESTKAGSREDATALSERIETRHHICLELYRERVQALLKRFSQSTPSTNFGDKFTALIQRLSLENPAFAQIVEKRFAGQLARQALAFIDRKLENAQLKCVGNPLAGEPAYTIHALLLLDLKKLHQAVGGMYGGVAFADDVRRLLMTVGALGFRLLPTQPEFSAESVTSTLSEIALRAGLIAEPLESMESAAWNEALAGMTNAQTQLLSWLSATVLTATSKGVLANLRAIALALRSHDDTAVEAIALNTCVGVLDIRALLSLLGLIEREQGMKAGGISEYISIIPTLAPELVSKGEGAFIEALAGDAVVKAWADSRGGLIELRLASQRSPQTSRLSQAWKSYVRRTLAVDHARKHGLVLCCTIDAEDPAALAFPSDGLQQMLRLRSNREGLNDVFAEWTCARTLATGLTEVTHEVYLNNEHTLGEESMRPLRSLMRFLAIRGDETAAGVLADIQAESAGKVSATMLDGITRRWLGPGLALTRFLNGEEGFEGAPADPVARRALLDLGIRGWEFLRREISGISEWLRQNPFEVLSFHLWKTLPRGHFGQTLAQLELGYRNTEATWASLGAMTQTEPEHEWSQILRDADWLLELSHMDAQS